MCGIIAFIPKNPKATNTGKFIIEQYQRQHGRGQKGFGLISVGKNKITIDRATEPVKALMDVKDSIAPIQIFHHRMPTSTENEIEQTHPFIVSHDELDFDYCMVHNGVIRNASELMKYHTEELGYVYHTYQKPSTINDHYGYTSYRSFNDSEALAIETARYFDGKSDSIGAYGTIACIVIRLTKKTHKPVTLIWTRNDGNPIEMVETPNGLLIASEVYHEDAELVPGKTFEEISLTNYFNSKRPHKSIIKLIAGEDANYKEEPPRPPVVTRTLSNYNSPAMGFKSNDLSTPTPGSDALAKDDEREVEEPISRRALAFRTMAERVISDMETEIYDFFDTLSERKMDEDDAISIANYLHELLIEKVESANNKVRPYFDKIENLTEDPDLETLLEFDEITQQLELENIDFQDTHEPSISERADAQRRRFDEMMY